MNHAYSNCSRALGRMRPVNAFWKSISSVDGGPAGLHSAFKPQIDKNQWSSTRKIQTRLPFETTIEAFLAARRPASAYAWETFFKFPLFLLQQVTFSFRYGFNTPPNYSDHELYCGGYSRQWRTNGGKCGICGDPWDTKQVLQKTVVINIYSLCNLSSSRPHDL